MSFKTSGTIAGADVDTNDTIVFPYPNGTSAGSFASYGHKLWVDRFQRLLEAPSDFTVAFGATEITVTYKGATTIPEDARLNAQFNIEGADRNEDTRVLMATAGVKRTVLGSVARVTLGSPIVADPNGYVESQNLTSAGVFSVDGTAAAALAAAALNGKADVPRNVVAAWTGAAVLTVTGEDEYGNVVKESSDSGTAFVGKKAFAKVTDISVSANVTDLTVGTGNVFGLPSFLSDESYVVNVKEGDTVYDKASKLYLNSDTPVLSTTGQVYGVSPIAGHVKEVFAVTNVAVTSADSTLTVKTAAGTVGTLTIATSGSAVGVVDTLNLAPVNTLVLAGGTVEIENDDAAGAGAASITTVIEPGGLLTAGVSAEATATTGDVRGTYTPIATPDGQTELTLFILEPEVGYKGVAQFA